MLHDCHIDGTTTTSCTSDQNSDLRRDSDDDDDEADGARDQADADAEDGDGHASAGPSQMSNTDQSTQHWHTGLGKPTSDHPQDHNHACHSNSYPHDHPCALPEGLLGPALSHRSLSLSAIGRDCDSDRDSDRASGRRDGGLRALALSDHDAGSSRSCGSSGLRCGSSGPTCGC
eukprot:1813100-Rhodomonas_salina.1